MGDTFAIIIIVLIALLIFMLLFLGLREVNCWYWKIDEKISAQHKTNYLLEKLLIQLGATNLSEITVEEISNGKKKKVQIDELIKNKIKAPKDNRYRTVKDEINEI